MAGFNAGTVGHADGDGVGIGLASEVGTGRFEIVASSAGIGDGVVVKWGWGTACDMMHIRLSNMVMSKLGRPDLSGAGIGLVHGGLGAPHGIVPCRLGLMVLGWPLASITAMRIRDVGSMGPAVI
jgi:hypothetical protein